jgi:hypothetical protein
MQDKNAFQTRRTPPDKVRDNTAEGNLATVSWKEIKAALTNIKEGLKKEKIEIRFIEELSRVIKRVLHALRKFLVTGIEARLKQIKKMLLEQIITKK